MVKIFQIWKLICETLFTFSFHNCCLHKCVHLSVYLLSVSIRSSATIQEGYHRITQTKMLRRPRSCSLCLQRKSSSSSRENTSAGLLKKRHKAHITLVWKFFPYHITTMNLNKLKSVLSSLNCYFWHAVAYTEHVAYSFQGISLF